MTVKTFLITQAMPWGFVDHLEVDPCGLLRITGWSQQMITAEIPPPQIALDNSPIRHLHAYRTRRPDVPAMSETLIQTGVVFEYLLQEDQYSKTFTQAVVTFPGAATFVAKDEFRFVQPHYFNLLTAQDVLHREHIYGFGPPNQGISGEIIPLLSLLKNKVLDFGCGSGATVRHLRSHGVDASGLELNSEIINNSLRSDVRPFITLYDGRMPSPFASKSFDCVYSSEVLEHIPNCEAAVAEMARLTRDQLILTTPDISAIPIGFRSGAVPWHLLEGTHVNFFTQFSLRRLLERHFSRIEFGRISPSSFNGSNYYVSLVALCHL